MGAVADHGRGDAAETDDVQLGMRAPSGMPGCDRPKPAEREIDGGRGSGWSRFAGRQQADRPAVGGGGHPAWALAQNGDELAVMSATEPFMVRVASNLAAEARGPCPAHGVGPLWPPFGEAGGTAGGPG